MLKQHTKCSFVGSFSILKKSICEKKFENSHAESEVTQWVAIVSEKYDCSPKEKDKNQVHMYVYLTTHHLPSLSQVQHLQSKIDDAEKRAEENWQLANKKDQLYGKEVGSRLIIIY